MMEYTFAKDPQVPDPNQKYQYLIPDEWRDIYEFDAPLKITGWDKGRSAVRFNVENLMNHECYSMGISKFYQAVSAWGVELVVRLITLGAMLAVRLHQ